MNIFDVFLIVSLFLHRLVFRGPFQRPAGGEAAGPVLGAAAQRAAAKRRGARRALHEGKTYEILNNLQIKI